MTDLSVYYFARNTTRGATLRRTVHKVTGRVTYWMSVTLPNATKLVRVCQNEYETARDMAASKDSLITHSDAIYTRHDMSVTYR